MIKRKEQLKCLIERRQRQILVHSIIYYKYDQNIISDYTWSKWAKELYEMQRANPDIAKDTVLYDIFKDFDYSTGSNLPIDHEWGNAIANRLMHYYGLA
ncbi:DNA ligase LigA-related protein [Dialister hominis]|uniref:DNA ligase LigA-related protein n=1 Tax=Dialister hominis TaxID=2582419 RepID=UPI003FEE65A9